MEDLATITTHPPSAPSAINGSAPSVTVPTSQQPATLANDSAVSMVKLSALTSLSPLFLRAGDNALASSLPPSKDCRGDLLQRAAVSLDKGNQWIYVGKVSPNGAGCAGKTPTLWIKSTADLQLENSQWPCRLDKQEQYNIICSGVSLPFNNIDGSVVFVLEGAGQDVKIQAGYN